MPNKSRFDEKFDSTLTPSINWLISCLVKNVSHHEWIDKEDHDETRHDYPYKAVPIPIAEGNTISLEKDKIVATFKDEESKNLFIELAKRYEFMEKEYYRVMGEFESERWRAADDIPVRIKSEASSIGSIYCLVTSPSPLSYL